MRACVKAFLNRGKHMFEKVARRAWMGRRASQEFWEGLHRLSLEGMNVGSGSRVEESGELWVLNHIAQATVGLTRVVVFDVGAGVGEYASRVISRFGTRVRLFCFEPSRKAFGLLQASLGSHENVQLFNFGLGDREEWVALYSDVEGSGLSSVYNRRLDHLGKSMKYTERIRLETLDSFCKERGIEHVHLLKLDVEGHEFNVLKGAHGMIVSNSIDFIQFEFGGCNIDSGTYFRDFFYLLHPYYEIHRILKDGLRPVREYKESHEMFLTTNYLAISRAKYS